MKFNKCDKCGKFIPFEDFETGKATRIMLFPDSETTVETYETLCKDHTWEKRCEVNND